MYSGAGSRGLASGLVVEGRALKKGEIKGDNESLDLSNMVMPFAELGDGWESSLVLVQ